MSLKKRFLKIKKVVFKIDCGLVAMIYEDGLDFIKLKLLTLDLSMALLKSLNWNSEAIKQ